MKLKPTQMTACFVLLTSIVIAQEAQMSVTSEEANAHLLQKVDPTVPPLAKLAKVGGTVELRITISPTGDVVPVKTISGHPMLVGAAIEAAKKWKYRPFDVAGKPVSVVTDVKLDFPAGMSQEESAARNRFFPIVNECRKMINQAQYGVAEKKCREAVEVSDQLPKDVILERSDARSLLANSIFLQQRYSEAIPLYEEALNLDQGYRKPDDADLASDYWNLGRACAMTGSLNRADELYAKAVSTFEAAVLTLPDMKENYTQRLKRCLSEYAQLKETEGENDRAAELRKKASRL